MALTGVDLTISLKLKMGRIYFSAIKVELYFIGNLFDKYIINHVVHPATFMQKNSKFY